LFKHWTGSSANLEHILEMDGAPTLGHPVPVRSAQPSTAQTRVDVAVTDEDEDLLDY
jgi:hypothetical protein